MTDNQKLDQVPAIERGALTAITTLSSITNTFLCLHCRASSCAATQRSRPESLGLAVLWTWGRQRRGTTVTSATQAPRTGGPASPVAGHAVAAGAQYRLWYITARGAMVGAGGRGQYTRTLGATARRTRRRTARGAGGAGAAWCGAGRAGRWCLCARGTCDGSINRTDAEDSAGDGSGACEWAWTAIRYIKCGMQLA